MPQQIQLNLDPSAAADNEKLLKIAAGRTGLDKSEIKSLRILKKSVDARKRNIRVNLLVEVISEKEPPRENISPFQANDVTKGREVIIVGAGPAGLFAALRLI